MFRNIAEKIGFYLQKKRILRRENIEIYVYALEVLLLNSLLLIVLLIISLLMEQLLFWVYFICFFVPLRIYSGGYHAKKSETCFVMSVVCYLTAMFILKNNMFLYENIVALVITALIFLMIFFFSPIENSNHPLTQYRKNRNRIIVRIIVVIDVILLTVFGVNHMSAASYEMIFLMLNGGLFLLGRIENFKKGDFL